MRDFRDAKAMAQTLRDALKARSISLTHSESLEVVARTLGFHDWNALAAAIDASGPADDPPPKVPAQSDCSMALPVIPLRDLVVFPQMVVPLFVGRDKTKRAIERARANDGALLIVTQRRAGDDDPTLDDLYSVGVMAKVIQQMQLNDDTLKVTISGVRRVGIARLAESEFLAAEPKTIEDVRGEPTEETIALSREIAETYQGYAKSTVARFLGYIAEPGLLADTAAPLVQMLFSPGIDRMQQILETADVVERLTMILALLKAAQQAKP
jgi:ATP-dependent Lon protease